MAGRFVLLEFEDRDKAQAFTSDPDLNEDLGYIVKGMWLKPRKFCQCSTKQKHTMNNWSKDPKYGLYICKKCRRPSRHHESGILSRLQYVLGFSLLPERSDA